VIYHGDIDFVPSQVRVEDAEFFSGQPLSPDQHAKSLERLERFKAAHIRLMNDMEVIGNVTASNIPFYLQHGHPCAMYVPNTWIDPGKEHAQEIIDAAYQRLAKRNLPVKIVGHVGYLNRTGSNYGLRFLADLLPELDRVMANENIDFRVHIIGSGDLLPSLKPRLTHPKVILSGYAEDLDRELEDSDIFLFLNNSGPLIAAYTRHVVAWASGLCLIAHKASTLAIPEITHMENAIVGEAPSQLAESIRQVVVDPDLNRRIRSAGRATYEQHFTPRLVATQVIDIIEGL
jgi:glycosyltransferase involved in cell wall biosynthesis